MTTIALAPGSPAPLAYWARALAVFCVQLVVLTILLHRFAGLQTPVALNIFAVSLAGAALALLIGVVALGQIWFRGRGGAMSATLGALIALGLFAWPVANLPAYLKSPPINDITTDTESPPQFRELAKQRTRGANTPRYPGREFAATQVAAYPDVRPFVIPRSVTDSFDLALDVAHRLRWTIVAEEAPRGKAGSGSIEAVDRTPVLGFSDDVAIRITGDQERTRIDIRSASRYGRHDLGRNADRVREFYRLVLARLEGKGLGEGRGRRRLRTIGSPPTAAKAEPSAKGGRPPQAGAAQSGAQREPEPKEKQRAKVERRSRDKQ